MNDELQRKMSTGKKGAAHSCFLSDLSKCFLDLYLGSNITAEYAEMEISTPSKPPLRVRDKLPIPPPITEGRDPSSSEPSSSEPSSSEPDSEPDSEPESD